jgi:hypothetical protein
MDLRTAQLDVVGVWRQAREQYPSISLPHLVEPKPAYFTQDVRLMVVGQETFGWGTKEVTAFDDDQQLVDDLLACYARFDLGIAYRSTPFWAAANALFAGLNPDASERAYIWSNLVKLDNNRQRVNSTVEDALAAANLLPLEISSFQPNAIVFFTGRRYDRRLASTFSGMKCESVSPDIARIIHPQLPHRTFRTHHPKFLRLSRRWPVVAELTSLCQLSNER